MAEGDEQYEMETTESGASDTHMVEAGQIRKGGYIMVKGKACKVKDVSVSKTGKHGHAKCKFSASCIFTGATCEELCPSTHSIAVPFVKKSDFQVMGLEGDYLQLMDEDMEMKEDLQLPNVDYKTDDDSYVHEDIAAEPYVHAEIAAAPYVHEVVAPAPVAVPYVHTVAAPAPVAAPYVHTVAAAPVAAPA